MPEFNIFRIFRARGQAPARRKGTKSFACPYCFETIRHDEVCFLVPYTQQEITYTEAELSVMDPAVAKTIRQEQAEIAPFRKRDSDEKLENFWRHLGGIDAYSNNPAFEEELQWNSPLVTPENAGEMTESGYEKDKDGFVVSVTDRLSKKPSKLRLCPHCHNVLPEGYGKYPLHFISIVGITSSGKTVYLTQLLSEIEAYLGRMGVTVCYKDKEARRFKSIRDSSTILPNATTRNDLRPPITITAQEGSSFYTLVFYDIAGENCVDPDKQALFGPYISHSDGIIVLIDPAQFPLLRTEIAARHSSAVGSPNTATVHSVLQTMNQSFLTERKNQDGKVEMPFAFVVSKSDYLDEILREDPNCENSAIIEMLPDPDPNRPVVSYGELVSIDLAVRQLLAQHGDPTLYAQIGRDFANSRFFAVSALGVGTRLVLSHTAELKGSYNIFLDDESESREILIELSPDSEKCLASRHALRELLTRDHNTILRYDLKTRELTEISCLPKARDRTALYLEADVNNPEKAGFYELFFSDNADGEGQSPVLTQGAKFDFFKTPEAYPQPRRIAEPLYWMLSQFGLLDAE